MIVTLQSHFDHPIGRTLCEELVEMGIDCFRLSMFNATITDIQKSMLESLDAGGDFILTTRDLNLIRMVGRVKIEYDNEPDYRVELNEYHNGFMTAYEICKENNNTLMGPCISNTDEDSIEWLNKFIELGVPDDVIISYHTYRPGSWKNDPEKPHKGFSSRDGEIKWLKAASGVRKLWCTENGYKKNNASIQAKHLQFELEFAQRHCIEGYTYYQLNDDPIHNEPFGLRDKNFQWKPELVNVIKKWKADHA